MRLNVMFLTLSDLRRVNYLRLAPALTLTVRWTQQTLSGYFLRTVSFWNRWDFFIQR